MAKWIEAKDEYIVVGGGFPSPGASYSLSYAICHAFLFLASTSIAWELYKITFLQHIGSLGSLVPGLSTGKLGNRHSPLFSSESTDFSILRILSILSISSIVSALTWPKIEPEVATQLTGSFLNYAKLIPKFTRIKLTELIDNVIELMLFGNYTKFTEGARLESLLSLP